MLTLPIDDDLDQADWLRQSLPEGVTDAASLLAYLEQIGQDLRWFQQLPLYRRLLPQHQWLRALDQQHGRPF